MKSAPQHIDTLIIGGGQAGLSVSYYLKQKALPHLILEKHTVMHTWRDHRWDNFCLVTPNWQCRLPGHHYAGDDPHGFMVKNEILDYLQAFADKLQAPVREKVCVEKVRRNEMNGLFSIETSEGQYTANQVVIASGAYHIPVYPEVSRKLPADIVQLHAGNYRSPGQLPDGNVLVVGAGQSGAQIAEDLHLAGRQVYMATGRSPRCARFYRGRDVVDWLYDMGYYDMPVEKHRLREGVRDNTNHYVTGRDGGRDLDLRKFALEGMELYGALRDYSDGSLLFDETLASCLDHADEVYNGINERIDRYIEERGTTAPPGFRYEPVWHPETERRSLDLADSGITSVIWCVGFKPDYGWCELPVFDEQGKPRHYRGVTALQGVYFIGLPWLHTWGSGRFSDVARDANYLADHLASQRLRSGGANEVPEPDSEADPVAVSCIPECLAGRA